MSARKPAWPFDGMEVGDAFMPYGISHLPLETIRNRMSVASTRFRKRTGRSDLHRLVRNENGQCVVKRIS